MPYRQAFPQILKIERNMKRELAIAQRGAERWLVQERSSAWMMVHLSALHERMRGAILNNGYRAYEYGWKVGEIAITRAKSRFRGGDEIPVPEIPSEWKRWYEGTVDDALHRYTEELRKKVAKLVTQGAVDGWDFPTLTEKIGNLANGMVTWRADNIARTETMRMWNIGHYGRCEQEEEVVGYEYDVTLDDRTTHYCRPLAGLKVKRENMVHIPPLHFRCRSVLNPVFSFDDTPEGEWGDGAYAAGIPGFGTIPHLPSNSTGFMRNIKTA